MAILRSRPKVVLAKIETTEGTDAAPAAASDAILTENARLSSQQDLVETKEHTGSLDGAEDIVGGTRMQLAFDCYMKGSGTAGGAPEIAPLLKACGWAETLTAAAVPAAPEACGAGGSTTTAELGATAVGTLQLYRGMPITIAGGAAGDSFVWDYSAAKLAKLTDTFAQAIDAGETYQILKNARYVPTSAAIPSVSLYAYEDGILWKILGARGDFTFGVDSGGAGKFSFTFTGMFGGKSDAALPGTDAYQSTRPPILKGGVVSIERTAVALKSFALNNGNRLVYPPNPNAAESFDPAQIVERSIRASMDPNMTLVATADYFADMRAGTKRLVHARWGSVAGNRCAIVVPTFQFTKADPQDREGLLAQGVEGKCVGEDGAACQIAFW
jgi:hypothetical protein